MSAAGRQGDQLADLRVVDRVLDRVGDRRGGLADVDPQVEDETLADLALGLADAVVGVERQAADLDRDGLPGRPRGPRRGPRRRLCPRSPRRSLHRPSPAQRSSRHRQRFAHGANVVHAEDARAALVGEHVRGDRAGEPVLAPAPRGRREEIGARKLLREVPMRIGRPSVRSSSRRRAARGCGRPSCRTRSPGRAASRRSATPSPTANASALFEERPDIVDDVLVAGIPSCIVRGSPQHVHQAAVRAAVRDQPGHLRDRREARSRR